MRTCQTSDTYSKMLILSMVRADDFFEVHHISLHMHSRLSSLFLMRTFQSIYKQNLFDLTEQKIAL